MKIKLFIAIYIGLIIIAYLQRRYLAIGGEVLLPIIPMILYIERRYTIDE